MTPPQKPWERISQANQWSNNFAASTSTANGSNDFNGTQQNGVPNQQTNNNPSIPPPLPPRPRELNSYSQRYNNVNPFSHLSCNPFYGGIGSYGSYGSYGLGSYGMNRYGYGSGYGSGYYGAAAYNGQESEFARLAEDSSRQAFQSIESLVQAFASVSMMLESTYFAVHSSFRAVIGVADHFSRLRTHLTQVLSTLALIRTFKWIIRRLLYFVGLRSELPRNEEAWSEANSTLNSGNSLGSLLNQDGTFNSNRSEDDISRQWSSWPILIFFSVVLGTPWLIWRLLSTLAGSGRTASDKWASEEDEHYEASAIYDFQTESPRELSFSSGQRIIIAPRDLQPRVRGWLLASDGKKVGLIPANYVRILGLRKGKNCEKNH